MTTVSGLRTQIANRLATISGLRTAATVPDSPNPPIAIVMPTGITYDTTMGRGLDEYDFTILVIVGRVDERTAQNALDAYCAPTGAGSIKAAMHADRTLGGTAHDSRVTAMRNYQGYAVGEVTYLAAEFVVSVIAT